MVKLKIHFACGLHHVKIENHAGKEICIAWFAEEKDARALVDRLWVAMKDIADVQLV
jgi:hypothetical protein